MKGSLLPRVSKRRTSRGAGVRKNSRLWGSSRTVNPTFGVRLTCNESHTISYTPGVTFLLENDPVCSLFLCLNSTAMHMHVIPNSRFLLDISAWMSCQYLKLHIFKKNWDLSCQNLLLLLFLILMNITQLPHSENWKSSYKLPPTLTLSARQVNSAWFSKDVPSFHGQYHSLWLRTHYLLFRLDKIST